MADDGERLLLDDELRFVDVLLDEALGPAPRAVALPNAPPRRRGRLAAAALLALGLGVLCATALRVRERQVPVQDPVPPPARKAETPPALDDLREAVHTIEPLADVVLGERDPARGLTTWGGPAAGPAAPRIADPRDPWARPDPGSVRFRAEAGAPVVQPRLANADTPALGLLRDVLPGRGGAATAAVVSEPSQLAGEPGHLQSLRCDGGDPGEVAAALRRFPNLRSVVLGAVLDDRVAAALSGCRELEELEAEALDLGGTGLGPLAGLPALRSLTLGGRLPGDVAVGLAGLRRLERLRLVAPWPGDAGALLGAVRRLPALRELQCVLPALPAAAAWSEALVALPELRRLGVVVAEGPLGALARVAAALPLECVRLGGGELLAADLRQLTRMPALRCLDLRGTAFAEPDAAADALAAAQQLRWLGLAFTNLDAAQRQALRTALPDCVQQSEVRSTRADGKPCFVLHDLQRVSAPR